MESPTVRSVRSAPTLGMVRALLVGATIAFGVPSALAQEAAADIDNERPSGWVDEARLIAAGRDRTR